jgi:hypothetical protein
MVVASLELTSPTTTPSLSVPAQNVANCPFVPELELNGAADSPSESWLMDIMPWKVRNLFIQAEI